MFFMLKRPYHKILTSGLFCQTVPWRGVEDEPDMFLLDIQLAGYPANLKAGYQVRNGYRISGHSAESTLRCAAVASVVTRCSAD
jgi:hypothetical protein